MQIYYGRTGTTYRLAQELGAGGEGKVYEVEGKPNIIAKLYHDARLTCKPDDPDPRRTLREKITTMLDQPVSPYVGGVLTVAWPQDLLLDASGRFVGFTMPKVQTQRHIFEVESPVLRQRVFPRYRYRSSVVVAYNLALAVSNVHCTGAVIGDMNAQNILVDSKGHVTLIDTDSFDITNRRTGAHYKCGVGTADVLAPELQGKNLSSPTSRFTRQTDCFALAIHVFELLNENIHPFSCVLTSHPASSRSCTKEAKICRGQCPHVTHPIKGIAPIPAAATLNRMPPYIQDLVDRAFTYDVTTALKPETIARRPSAEEWKNALRRLLRDLDAGVVKAKTNKTNVPVQAVAAPTAGKPVQNVGKTARAPVRLSAPMIGFVVGGLTGLVMADVISKMITFWSGASMSVVTAGFLMALAGAFLGCFLGICFFKPRKSVFDEIWNAMVFALLIGCELIALAFGISMVIANFAQIFYLTASIVILIFLGYGIISIFT